MAALFPWLVVALTLPALSLDAPESAYEAEIVGNDVFAFSGPGTSYYPTAMLRAGDIITVRGAAKEGWLPIDPPPGSFSWVPGDHVKELPDGRGVVTENETRVRLGSLLSDAHHVHQVTLRKGDVVQLVDEQTLTSKDATGRWYKITPPSSERRYIPAAAIRVAATGAPADAPAPELTRTTASSPTRNQDLLPIAARVGVRIIPPADPVQRASTDIARGSASGFPASTKEKLTPIALDPSEPFVKRAEKLAEQLTEMRTRLPDQWNLPAARQAIDQLRKAAKTDADKSLIVGLEQLEKQMNALGSRYQEIASRREVFLKQDRELSLMLKQTLSDAGAATQNFDADGVLRRASVTIDGETTYMLESPSGEATHYVNFAPGLSGESYLGRRVGLIGKISKRDHVPIPRLIVEQVMLLSD